MKNNFQIAIEQAEQALKDANLLWHTGRSHRAAISRAYYAIFYASQSILETKQLVASSHKAQISLFGEHFIKPGIFPKKLGKMFGTFFSLRQNSDYDLLAEIQDDEVEEALKDAQEFVREIKNHLVANGFIEEGQ